MALSDIDWVNRTSWFGIWIAPGQQGRGVGSAATRLAAEYGRDRLGLRRVKLLVLADHEAAISVYRRVGFAEEGRLVGEILDGGTARDLLLLALQLDGGDE